MAYATLALGSAMALFLYPHAITAVLSSRSQDVVRRNMSLLPAWTFLLGLMALLGYMAIAAGINVAEPNLTVPGLFRDMFPSWFVGVAFAAIAIGALVPAAVMSIAAANLFTRNIWKEFVRPDCSDAEESRSRSSCRSSSRSERSRSSCCCRRSSRSTSSCSAACGCCRRCRPS